MILTQHTITDGATDIDKLFIKQAFKGRADCRACAIRHLVLFAGLEEEHFDLIHRPIEDLTYPTGAFLYGHGEEGASLFTVRSGLVKLVQYAPDGNQRIVRLLRSGDVTGLEAMLGSPYRHDAVIMREAQVCRLPVELLQRLNQATPQLHQELMARWQRALNDADSFLTELSTGTARARVARLLRRLIAEDGTCALPGREDMGAMLGITTETASRTIAALKREGAITDTGHDTVRCETDRLGQIAGD